MATARKKPAARKAPKVAAKEAAKAPVCPPGGAVLTPVAKKIGEPPGNLQARAAAFSRRRGKPG